MLTRLLRRIARSSSTLPRPLEWRPDTASLSCPCCGCTDFESTNILWKELVDEWRLSPDEAAYINRQQGLHCARCRNNLRSMTLARAICRLYSWNGTLDELTRSERFRALRIVELNEAGQLTRFLAQAPGHVLLRYPEADLHDLKLADGSVDLLVHSDTLEHVAHPLRGLAECRRVVAVGGALAFTVPIVVGRQTSSRAGLPDSYHEPTSPRPDMRVATEFGSDVWTFPLRAGFSECRIVSIEFPAGNAILCLP